MNEVRTAIDVIGIIILIAGAFLVVRSQNLKDTIKQQTVLIDTYKDRLEILEVQHIENAKRIGELQGEINAYKKIPLDNIAKSLKQIANTNAEILKMVKET